MEDGNQTLDLSCYCNSIKKIVENRTINIMFDFWCDEIDDVVRVMRFAFRKIIKPDRQLNMTKLRFDTPREYSSSMRIISKMMNTAVPNRDGIYFKNILFDLMDEFSKHTMFHIKRKKWHNKFLFLEACYKLKAAYTIYEIKRFLQETDKNSLNIDKYFNIALAYGGAFQVLDYFDKFSIKYNYDTYHRISQSLKRTGSRFEYDPGYKDAVRFGLDKIRDGDPCDHAELLEFLLKRPEFSHLKKSVLKPMLIKKLEKLNRVKGRKGYKKIQD